MYGHAGIVQIIYAGGGSINRQQNRVSVGHKQPEDLETKYVFRRSQLTRKDKENTHVVFSFISGDPRLTREKKNKKKQGIGYADPPGTPPGKTSLKPQPPPLILITVG